jgi:hypothetical protein
MTLYTSEEQAMPDRITWPGLLPLTNARTILHRTRNVASGDPLA